MFGMGFMEIFLIAVVAIIALGPEKLPTAMVEIAKFIKKFKSGVEDAKSTLDNELNITEMKAEASKFKAQIDDAKSSVDVRNNLDLGLDDILNGDDKVGTTSEDEEPKKEKTTPKKIKKKKKEEATPKKADSSDKFKVDFDKDEEDK